MRKIGSRLWFRGARDASPSQASARRDYSAGPQRKPPKGCGWSSIRPAAVPIAWLSVAKRASFASDHPNPTAAGEARAADTGPSENRHADALIVRFMMADADSLRPIGAVPKAVSLHELHIVGNADGWSCAVTLDV
jgi:hypothetical protein